MACIFAGLIIYILTKNKKFGIIKLLYKELCQIIRM